MNDRKFGLLIVALIVGATTLIGMPAKASISLTPTIIVIEGRQRYADMYVVNTTNERQTYELKWKYLKMEGAGNYKETDKSLTEFDLAQNVIFSPRKVTLPPKGSQKIRFALRLQGPPPPQGDYRAHISLVNYVGRETQQPEILKENESQVSMGVNLGFSIPVIYRVGDEDGGGATIGNITTEINPKTNKIDAVIPLTRKPGPYGAIGRLQVSYDGKLVGQITNANIFPEIDTRIFRVSLNTQSLSGGKLTVTYKDYDETQDKIFDEKSVNIAQ